MDLQATDVIARYWAIGFFIISVVMLCALMLGLSTVLGGRSRGRSKSLPFESGVIGTGTAHQRFSAQFYLVAMLFVIFDIEAVFLFAWAISVKEVGWGGFWGLPSLSSFCWPGCSMTVVSAPWTGRLLNGYPIRKRLSLSSENSKDLK